LFGEGEFDEEDMGGRRPFSGIQDFRKGAPAASWLAGVQRDGYCTSSVLDRQFCIEVTALPRGRVPVARSLFPGVRYLSVVFSCGGSGVSRYNRLGVGEKCGIMHLWGVPVGRN
jgi:hypothetical protein